MNAEAAADDADGRIGDSCHEIRTILDARVLADHLAEMPSAFPNATERGAYSG
ncbi:MAG: hypothetical protein JST91_23320 [Actinobacteria bacterium]|nr:hypothetical protein [Actinomycetota bacterium]